MPPLATQIADAAEAIRRRWDCRPTVGIILGSGLGGFTEEISQHAAIDYGEIPHFVRSTAVGHKGQLVCGRVAGVPVMAMEGRLHLYEGYSPQQITLPVRVMQALGVELLVISNAAGGLRPHFAAGDIVVIDDHINFMAANPLVGLNESALGARFPDMSRPYDARLVRCAMRVARRENTAAHQGVYVAVSGPNFETRAEYRFFRKLGADVIGMSTVPEVIVAAQIGLRVLALSVVTNVCSPDAAAKTIAKTDGQSVVETARSAERKLPRSCAACSLRNIRRRARPAIRKCRTKRLALRHRDCKLNYFSRMIRCVRSTPVGNSVDVFVPQMPEAVQPRSRGFPRSGHRPAVLRRVRTCANAPVPSPVHGASRCEALANAHRRHDGVAFDTSVPRSADGRCDALNAIDSHESSRGAGGLSRYGEKPRERGSAKTRWYTGSPGVNAGPNTAKRGKPRERGCGTRTRNVGLQFTPRS